METEIQGYCSDDDTYVVSFDEDCFDATLTKSGGEVESWQRRRTASTAAAAPMPGDRSTP